MCREIGIKPKPPAAVIPLGTGNGMSVNLGWGHKASKAWVKDRHSMSDVSNTPCFAVLAIALDTVWPLAGITSCRGLLRNVMKQPVSVTKTSVCAL